jgi:hypothetical protein
MSGPGGSAWGLAGLVGVGSGSLTWTRGIGLWFLRQRGLALGIALIGTSFTGVLVPQFAGAVIDQFGWRAAFPVLAMLPLFIALPIVWLWFREPAAEDRPVGVLRGRARARLARIGGGPWLSLLVDDRLDPARRARLRRYLRSPAADGGARRVLARRFARRREPDGRRGAARSRWHGLVPRSHLGAARHAAGAEPPGGGLRAACGGWPDACPSRISARSPWASQPVPRPT